MTTADTHPDVRRHLRALLERIDVDEIIRRRAVQEAISEALACTWTRRAHAFEQALPRANDYPGGPVDWDTGQPLNPPRRDPAWNERLQATTLACRQKAALLEAGWIDG